MKMTIKKNFTIWLVMAVSAFNTSVAQEIPPGPFFPSYPESGSWFAMDDSNTGFFMSVQNGIMAGAYFGFDGEGDNVWLLFNGPLEPVFETTIRPLQTGWRLQTNLTQGANGGCIINCINDNTEPRQSAVVDSIVLEFTARSTATFAVGSNEPVDIFPLYFGVPAFTEPLIDVIQDDNGNFSEQDVLAVSPDLEGTWLVAVGQYRLDGVGSFAGAPLAESAGIIEIGPREFVTFAPIGIPPALIPTQVTEAPVLRDTTGLFGDNPRLRCSFNEEFSFIEGFEPDGYCTISPLNPDRFSVRDIFEAQGRVHIQSDSRFIMQVRRPSFTLPATSGLSTRVEFFRLGYN